MADKELTPGPINCPQCESNLVQATGSAQYRQVHGERRLTADLTCPNCGHQWWSVNKSALAMSRDVDRQRKKDARTNGDIRD